MGRIELPSPAWKAGVIAVIRHPQVNLRWEYSFMRISFRKIIVYFRFHFLLRSTNSMRVIIGSPIFKSQSTLFLINFFNSAELIHTCGVRSLWKESHTSCGSIVAGNNSQLCTHLSIVTDNHFCSIFVFRFWSQFSN